MRFLLVKIGQRAQGQESGFYGYNLWFVGPFGLLGPVDLPPVSGCELMC